MLCWCVIPSLSLAPSLSLYIYVLCSRAPLGYYIYMYTYIYIHVFFFCSADTSHEVREELSYEDVFVCALHRIQYSRLATNRAAANRLATNLLATINMVERLMSEERNLLIDLWKTQLQRCLIRVVGRRRVIRIGRSFLKHRSIVWTNGWPGCMKQ